MYPVSTVNLSPDFTRADVAFGTVDLGKLSAGDLVALLERFRHLDGVGNLDAEPHVILTGRSGRFHVRTGQGKLFLYNARATLEPYAELTAAEIVTQLERESVTAPPFPMGGSAASPPDARPPAAPHRFIAVAILVVGMALNGYTLYSVFYTDSVDKKPSVTLVTDAKEAAGRRQEIAGTYATGDRQGDRVIAITADGRVNFSEVGVKGGIGENKDQFKLGKRGVKYCLATTDSGVIDVLNIDTVVYYRDTYRRMR